MEGRGGLIYKGYLCDIFCIFPCTFSWIAPYFCFLVMWCWILLFDEHMWSGKENCCSCYHGERREGDQAEPATIWSRGSKSNFGDWVIWSFLFFLSHPANDYFLLFLVSRGCSADNMQIQRMCEIISRLSNVWGFALTQMELFGTPIHGKNGFLFTHRCSLGKLWRLPSI